MKQSRSLSLFIVVPMLAVLAIVPDALVQTSIAAARSLTDAQFNKIKSWITDKGNDVAISAMITDILGLTKNDESISSRAFAARDADTGDIHQIYALPGGKGYLEGHFHQDKVDVYWTDPQLDLIAAVTGVRGERPATTTSFQEAQAGFGSEVAWWAKFADAN
jgi:hypothetical protein